MSSNRELGVDVPRKISELCSILSKYYMITRYPDTREFGIPEDCFTERGQRGPDRSSSGWRRYGGGC